MTDTIIELTYKPFLTVEEASMLFHIGEKKIRQMTDDRGCDYVLFVGRKRLIIREKMQSYLYAAQSI